MPTLPKLTTCFERVTYIKLTVHYSCNKHGRDKTTKITMEFGAQSKTSITHSIRCSFYVDYEPHLPQH